MIERYFQKFGFDRYHQRGREGRRYAFAQSDKRQIGNGVAWLSAPDFLLNSVRNYEKDDDTVNEIAESLYEYNAVTSITHNDPSGTQIVKHSYTYDSTNNIVEYFNSIDGNTEYNYDYLGQLIGADHANQTDESYIYDSNGNRITANGSNYTTGENNELTSDGDYTYTYDTEGNRISKTNTSGTERELYTWDYRNRLTSVTKQTYNNSTNEWTTVQIVEYAYDYNNIWIRKTVGNDKTIFIPENYQTAVQIDNGITTHHYLWTPNAQDKLLADTTTDGVLWSLTDHLGTVRDILGTASTHLIYDAFGNLISGTNPLLFGFTGKAFDVSTNLQNNINRWYDSTVGRWLSTDPIGFNGNDMNLYRYVSNYPINAFDFNGLALKLGIIQQQKWQIEDEYGNIYNGNNSKELLTVVRKLSKNCTTIRRLIVKGHGDCGGVYDAGGKAFLYIEENRIVIHNRSVTNIIKNIVDENTHISLRGCHTHDAARNLDKLIPEARISGTLTPVVGIPETMIIIGPWWTY